ncbi:MAG: nucleic acid-binding protein [Candidatus Thermoplasmatota archaeon]|jgi:UPF0271 protein|nr:nucleic acid-binding protein [Candidatus Thermoplasmatota archaeon]MCL5790134.1 nucleic acid-binding protein [Candidatus Thermoplasmatota archaeon]
MKIVVDASALFYGFRFDGRNEYITTSSVIEEIRNKQMKKSLSMGFELLKVLAPSAHNLEEVKRSAVATGDIGQLSRTDIEIIALAKELDALLLTNDLAIQNVCRRMDVKYQSFGGKSIDTEIEWGYRCIGCKRRFSKPLDECPYCGNEIKRYPRKRKPIS